MIEAVSYCGPPPAPADLASSWNFDPVLLLALAALAALGARFLRGSALLRFAAGWTIAFLSFVSPLCAATSALFSARAAHHLLLVIAAAPLLASALPRAPRASLTAVAAAHAVILALWHVPAVYTAALSDDGAYWLAQLALLATAVLFWSEIRARALGGSLAGLLSIMMAMGVLGALLTFAPAPLYQEHFATTLAWGLAPLEDQQLAGLLMWVVAIPAYVGAAAILAARRLRAPARGLYA